MFGTFNSLLTPNILNFGATRAKSIAHKIFVYGTLKRDEPNHHWLTNKRNGMCNFQASGTTVIKYPLIVATRYNIPFLLKHPGNGHNVKGEVYEIDENMLGRLDLLEDHPNLYEREIDEIMIIKEEGAKEKVKCWIYFLQNFKPVLLKYPMIESYTSKSVYGKPTLKSSRKSANDDTIDLILKK